MNKFDKTYESLLNEKKYSVEVSVKYAKDAANLFNDVFKKMGKPEASNSWVFKKQEDADAFAEDLMGLMEIPEDEIIMEKDEEEISEGRINPDPNDVFTATNRVKKEYEKDSTLYNAANQFGSPKSKKLINSIKKLVEELAELLYNDFLKSVNESQLNESEVYFFKKGGKVYWSDDEGNTGEASRNAPVGDTLSYSQASRYMMGGGSGDDYRFRSSKRGGRYRY
jgi:hypothetical protein